ncbi:MAG: hypothetical protein A3Q59_02610 [Methanomethylophilus alvi]|nr:MAG: hypothetical protein A3Q59_02610 [Methanomethylophilus alvi]
MESLEPRFADGKPANMAPEQKERFMKAVARNMMAMLEAGEYLERMFNTNFASKHVREMLRKTGFRYAKPNDVEYCRPADAEAVLKKDSESH